jgi:hypothetical protein
MFWIFFCCLNPCYITIHISFVDNIEHSCNERLNNRAAISASCEMDEEEKYGIGEAPAKAATKTTFCVKQIAHNGSS